MLSHSDICEKIIIGLENIQKDEVVSAWVSSLATRNLAARSTFGSYVVLQNFEMHNFQSQNSLSDHCAYCGLTANSNYIENNQRIENYPFQVQHTSMVYAAHDISTFAERRVDLPTRDDIECLNNMMNGLRSLSPASQLSELNKSLQPVLKSNKHERTILLETFGYAGILGSSNQRNYTNQFLHYDFTVAQQPKEHSKREWAYPIRFWTGLDGVNEEMVSHYFGFYL